MTRRLILVIVLNALTLSVAAKAGAQTVPNGPYYATPSWDQTLPASTRFVVLSNFANTAVLDRETGLVWQQAPGSFELIWNNAAFSCMLATDGGRMGWRLPTIHELNSLVDVTTGSLPGGHPFSNVSTTNLYWSSTTVPGQSGSAMARNFFGFTSADTFTKGGALLAWCVRGGTGVDSNLF